MFPSLRGNPYREQLWRSHGATSLHPRISRASHSSMSTIKNWSSECNFCREHNIKVDDYDYDQLTADVARSHAGVGTSACAYIRASEAPSFLCSGLLEMSRERMAELVNQYDGKACDGLYPAVALGTKLTESSVPHYILEGDPDNPLTHIDDETRLASTLLRQHEIMVGTRSLMKIVFLITAIHSRGSGMDVTR